MRTSLDVYLRPWPHCLAGTQDFEFPAMTSKKAGAPGGGKDVSAASTPTATVGAAGAAHKEAATAAATGVYCSPGALQAACWAVSMRGAGPA